MLPEVAVTVAEPKPIAFASPAVPFALMPTIDGFADVHCTEEVRSCLVPSVKVPVAANCKLVPSGSDGAGGEIASEASTAVVTVTVVVPLTPEYDAVIVVEPSPLAVAIPELEIVAAAVLDELQVAELVTSRLLLSLYLPVALNC